VVDVVCIATRFEIGSPGIEPRWDRDFSHQSTPALGDTQPPVQRLPVLFPGCKWPVLGVTILAQRLKNSWRSTPAYYLRPQGLCWRKPYLYLVEEEGRIVFDISAIIPWCRVSKEASAGQLDVYLVLQCIFTTVQFFYVLHRY